MIEKVLNQSICLKEYINEKDYKDINKLKDICSLNDKTNLKLELDYRLNVSRSSEIGLNNVNEFFYYIEETLVAYLSISSFACNIAEINGMTHPDWRRKGIFKRLFNLAIEECERRNFSKVLLLTDDKSNPGKEFIKAVGGNYDFSEYMMKLIRKTSLDSINTISLKKAEKEDAKEIARQNAIFFNDPGESENYSETEETINDTYMIELKDSTIGKIRIEYSEDSAYIYGFGILPDFRRKGYGGAALKKALCLINEKNVNDVGLDVECKNSNALNLYKSCGFEEKSVMNYYNYSVKTL